MMYQRKSGPLQNNPSFKKQFKPNPQGENLIQSQPKFILKNPSYLHNRPFSALDYSDDIPFTPSYYDIYQQQKQRQNSSSPDIFDHSKQQINQRNQLQLENDHSQSSISMKLQEILQKQIVNPRQTKSKTQHTSNSSFEILNHNQSRRPNNSYHVFNSKPKSVDNFDQEQNEKSQSYFPQTKRNLRHEGPPTAQKNTFVQNKIQLMSNEILTPNNQITFSNENNQVEELTILRAENKKLLSINYSQNITIDSIKKLNLDFQQQKSGNNALQFESQKLRDQMNEQNDETNNMIGRFQKEKFQIQQQLIQKDSLINQLRQQLQDQDVENKLKKANSTHQEIDDLKNRIMARKPTQRSYRDNVTSLDQRDRHLNCDDILDEMDSSARLDIKSIRQQIADDKENVGRQGNINKQIFISQENKFRLKK